MTTGTGTSTISSNEVKKKGWPRGRKRSALPKDFNAPKTPLSGYILFLNDKRDSVKETNSKAGFSEINKILAQKWSQLDLSDKQKYLDAAEVDKERYQKELEEYKKTDTYKSFVSEKRSLNNPSKKPKKETMVAEKTCAPMVMSTIRPNSNSVLEIPIFTEEFLNHNKNREVELRQLRKSNTEYEEQNAILQKHIESMRTAVDKLESEAKQQKSNNDTLRQHLTTLRQSLTEAFSSTPIPGTNETPSENTMEEYLAKLHKTLSLNPQQHSKVIQNVKQIVNALPNN